MLAYGDDATVHRVKRGVCALMAGWQRTQPFRRWLVRLWEHCRFDYPRRRAHDPGRSIGIAPA
jgi:hypothetical protein